MWRGVPVPAAQPPWRPSRTSPVGVRLAQAVQEGLRVPEKRLWCGEEVGATDVEPDTLTRRWATELNPHLQWRSRSQRHSARVPANPPPPSSTGSVRPLIASAELGPAPGFDLRKHPAGGTGGTEKFKSEQAAGRAFALQPQGVTRGHRRSVCGCAPSAWYLIRVATTPDPRPKEELGQRASTHYMLFYYKTTEHTCKIHYLAATSKAQIFEKKKDSLNYMIKSLTK